MRRAQEGKQPFRSGNVGFENYSRLQQHQHSIFSFFENLLSLGRFSLVPQHVVALLATREEGRRAASTLPLLRHRTAITSARRGGAGPAMDRWPGAKNQWGSRRTDLV